MMAGCSHWPTSPNSPKTGRDDGGELGITVGASTSAFMVGWIFLLAVHILIKF
jgi:hypothetical protein